MYICALEHTTQAHAQPRTTVSSLLLLQMKARTEHGDVGVAGCDALNSIGRELAHTCGRMRFIGFKHNTCAPHHNVPLAGQGECVVQSAHINAATDTGSEQGPCKQACVCMCVCMWLCMWVCLSECISLIHTHTLSLSLFVCYCVLVHSVGTRRRALPGVDACAQRRDGVEVHGLGHKRNTVCSSSSSGRHVEHMENCMSRRHMSMSATAHMERGEGVDEIKSALTQTVCRSSEGWLLRCSARVDRRWCLWLR